eukprot:TRINITY_DN793_c0_g1_i1.p1 TRINITY_DN793_c0_g1~~TRINITY_DN793_c0_g1_i1.p1  ORF type:complete len:363 (-),score=77.14 TRINITY_DN793_c0_g1_i1:53-1141(-)
MSSIFSSSSPSKTKKMNLSSTPRPLLSLPDEATINDTDSRLKWKHIESLKQHGYCVVENALDVNEGNQIVKDWKKCYESYGVGFKAADPSTWKLSKHRPMGTRGMQDYPPVSQEFWVWNARLAMAPIFSALWQTSESGLLSSMDRVCFVPPTQLLTGKTWWHLDQSSVKRRGVLACVQGMLILEDIDEGDVALQVMANSHKHHAQFFEEHLSQDEVRFGKCKNMDWHKFNEGDTDWYLKQKDVEKVRVHGKKGSLILWDSRLPHHAVPPPRDIRSGRTRLCIYVCMVPRKLAPEKRILAHKKWFETGRATSHWPQDSKPFARIPRTYGGALREFPGFNLEKQLRDRDEKVSDVKKMRRLVGY